MKANLLDYLKPDKGEEAKGEKKEPNDKDPLDGMGKAELLAMKYEMTHEPEKRAKVLVALVECIAGKGEKPAEE